MIAHACGDQIPFGNNGRFWLVGCPTQRSCNVENRLIAWDPLANVTAWQRFRYKYDHRGRRVERRWEEYDVGAETWNLVRVTRYIWAGWLLVEEIDVDGSTLTPSKQYTWGLDLAGLSGSVGVPPASLEGASGGTGVSPVNLEGAGGVGGLLATRDLQKTATTADDRSYIHFYDANGNVGQLVDAENATLSLQAAYQYTPCATLNGSHGGHAADPS